VVRDLVSSVWAYVVEEALEDSVLIENSRTICCALFRSVRSEGVMRSVRRVLMTFTFDRNSPSSPGDVASKSALVASIVFEARIMAR